MLGRADCTKIVILLWVGLGLFYALSVEADERQAALRLPVRVAVAANFVQPATLIAKAFEQKTRTPVQIISGSTGKLFAQIVHGAPFDVFLSADQHAISELSHRGLIEPSSRITYAEGRLVLWPSANVGPLGLSLIKEPGAVLSRLQQKKIRLVSVPNPRLAPYGRAAKSVLMVLLHDQNDEKSRPTWKEVYAENVLQSYQFVYSGNADVGFLGLSQVFKRDKWQARGWLVPKHLHQPIYQDGAVIRRPSISVNDLVQRQRARSSRAFMAFLQSEASIGIISGHGYDVMPRSE